MKILHSKVCGLTEPQNIQAVCSCNPEYIGFIVFSGSKRCVDVELLSGAIEEGLVPPSIKKIGVFVNPSLDEVASISRQLRLDGVQLHGDETPSFCAEVRSLHPEVLLFKAVGISSGEDFLQLAEYQSLVNAFIFDTKTPLRGGSGKTFSWELLQDYKGAQPFFMSGGIGPDNIVEAVQVAKRFGAYGLDVNSRCESAPGVKDIRKVRQVLNTIQSGEKR